MLKNIHDVVWKKKKKQRMNFRTNVIRVAMNQLIWFFIVVSCSEYSRYNRCQRRWPPTTASTSLRSLCFFIPCKSETTLRNDLTRLNRLEIGEIRAILPKQQGPMYFLRLTCDLGPTDRPKLTSDASPNHLKGKSLQKFIIYLKQMYKNATWL